MELNVHKEVAALQRQGAKQLRARYAEVFGETTAANNKIWLIRRIAWRLQALAEGDLSERSFDRGYSGLTRDGEARGLRGETAVLCISEHGRTPQLANVKGGGRDHWSRAYSALFAGGGFAAGRVVG